MESHKGDFDGGNMSQPKPIIHLKLGVEDLRQESRERGFDPDRWYVVANQDGGYSVQKGALWCATCIFKDHAQWIVDRENNNVATN